LSMFPSLHIGSSRITEQWPGKRSQGKPDLSYACGGHSSGWLS
jgi:hypothetical protein